MLADITLAARIDADGGGPCVCVPDGAVIAYNRNKLMIICDKKVCSSPRPW